MDKLDRIYDLHHIFRARRHPVSMGTLCDEMECSPATVKRLIRTMRDLFGAPIYNVRGRGWRYDPTQRFELPGMWFNADELAALLTIQKLLRELRPGLLDEPLRPIRRRIDTLLQRAAPGAEREIGRIRLLTMMPRARNLPRFPAVAGAVLSRTRLRITYHARSDDATLQREVSPQRLVYYRDNWYLDAFCHLRGALRSFAIERITRVEKLKQPPVEIDDERLDHHFASAYGIFAGTAEATAHLRFTALRARWVADEIWHPAQEQRWLEDGRLELLLPYHDPTELILDICRLGPDVEVVSPEALRRAVAERLRAAAAQYD
ncbi:MAG: transcriptional regulator [Zetaproteobacteria bacterium]|nr:MAG: transcriptional regulator [Zetaproteobacteria bacterium]